MDSSQTLRQTWPRGRLGAAMCVQDVDVQCVLQFTLGNAASCALHRLASRVIHRSEVFSEFSRPPLDGETDAQIERKS